MTILQSYLEPDQSAATFGPTVFKTERNQHSFRCGKCGRLTYVDEDAFTLINYAATTGLDDPFRCQWCTQVCDDYCGQHFFEVPRRLK
jgi:hypothetical protein